MLRQRLALQSADASARILRLRADEAALRDLRFAATENSGPAAKLLDLWRDLVRRPPTLDGSRLEKTSALLDLALPEPSGLISSLKECIGEGDPVSAAAAALDLGADLSRHAETLLTVAPFERSLIRERTLAELAAARRAGRIGGAHGTARRSVCHHQF